MGKLTERMVNGLVTEKGEDAYGVFDAIGKARERGHASVKDVLEMQVAGIPFLSALSGAVGEPEEACMDRVRAGMVGFGDMMAVIGYIYGKEKGNG